MMSSSVECYLVPRTEDAPNSRLPILVYRDVLPHPRTEETATQFLTTHHWEKRVCHDSFRFFRFSVFLS
jgi:uncharacterized protein YjlB